MTNDCWYEVILWICLSFRIVRSGRECTLSVRTIGGWAGSSTICGMNTHEDMQRQVTIPFYVFLSLLLLILSGYGIRMAGLRGEWGAVLVVVVLLLLHVGLYWVNYFSPEKPANWWRVYYPAQAVLMIAITLLMNRYSDAGTSFIGSASLCIVGEALGFWGNSRRSLIIGVLFFGMMFGMFYLLMERQAFYTALFGMLVNGGAIVLFMVMYNQQIIERQKAMNLADSLESANAKLAAYNAKIESLTLQNERQRMARELHDTLAQGVAGLVLQLEAIKAHLKADRPERAITIVERSITRARSTLAESRAAIDDLRAVPVNVADVVREKVEAFKQSAGVACDLELSVTENQLTPEIIDHALNIMSESLTNIARHAEATQVKVKFFVQKQTLELEVCDNGKGFDAAQEPKGHYGLVGMHERARLTGGMLVIESNKKGSCIQFGVGRV